MHNNVLQTTAHIRVMRFAIRSAPFTAQPEETVENQGAFMQGLNPHLESILSLSHQGYRQAQHLHYSGMQSKRLLQPSAAMSKALQEMGTVGYSVSPNLYSYY